MERFPDRYPNQQALADRFNLSQNHVSELIKHYEFIEDLQKNLPSNIIARAIMLPEGFVREIRRAPEDLQPKLVRAVCIKSEAFETIGSMEAETFRSTLSLER